MKSFIIKIFRLISNWAEQDRQNVLRKKYNLHPSFRFNGTDILFYGGGTLQVSENSYIGGFSTIQLSENYTVKIGRNCRISHNVRIYTSSALADQDFESHNSLEKKFGDVIIEDNVWIGANVFINPGISIGKNTVIGANSVVTKDLESNAIYGGVPARLIKKKTNNA